MQVELCAATLRNACAFAGCVSSSQTTEESQNVVGAAGKEFFCKTELNCKVHLKTDYLWILKTKKLDFSLI